MKLMTWLTALGLGLLFFGGWWWWQQKVCCPPVSTPAASAASNSNLPYYFSGTNGNKLTSTAGFSAWADSAKNALGPDDRLMITGLWFTGEDSSAGNLGLQRAEALRTALSGIIPLEKMDIGSRFVNEQITDSVYLGNSIRVQSAPKLNSDSATSVMADGMLTVYFPSNSVKNIFDQQTEQNISNIIAAAKSTGRIVTVTGHTDDQGDSLVNKQLGLARAHKLKKLLQARGLSAQQIGMHSMGEAEPIADNSSTTGRATNRRVEVRLQQ